MVVLTTATIVHAIMECLYAQKWHAILGPSPEQRISIQKHPLVQQALQDLQVTCHLLHFAQLH